MAHGLTRILKLFPLRILLPLLPLMAAVPVQAQGLILPQPVPPIGRPIIRPVPVPQPLTVKSQKVTMTVNSGALKVQVEQVFANPNSVQMEGTYLFPLPEGATVSNFRLTVNNEPTEGKLLTVEEARRVYESYVRRNVDPAILEYVGRNAFQARVFPIPAGGERQIFLTYSQPLEFQNGVYKVTYPLNSERVTGGTAGNVVIDCTLRSNQPLKAIYSPSHEVVVKRESDALARVTFEARDLRANRDFLLYYSTSDKAFGLNALSHRRAGDDGYLMLMLSPKREVKAAEVQAKDVVFVFDSSGSMQGAKMEQARKALQTVLGALNDVDRFNIIRFSSDVMPFRSGVVPANAENRDSARKFVGEFKAVGGTAIDDALQAAFASLPNPDDRKGRGAFVIFMTDGLPTIGQTEPDRILQNAQKAAPADLRLFSFGVGQDVNTLLLDRLASDNRGAADYISDNEDLETKIGSFYTKIADPVLSNVRVTVDGVKVSDVQPARIPDLFAGSQSLLFGRYQGHGKATVTLAGEMNGQPRKFTYEVTLPEREPAQEFIPNLWAGRKIGLLLETIRLKGENKELKDEVIRLSKEFGIVTPYTAYLVEEPGLQQPLPQVRLGLEARGGFGGATGPAPASPQAAGKPAQSGGLPQGGAVPTDRFYKSDRLMGRQPVDEKKLAEVRRQQYGFSQTTGANAIESSRAVRALKERVTAGEDEMGATRQAGGRAFRYTEAGWLDGTAPTKPKQVAIKYGSDAYFKLLSANKEWTPYLALGRRVTFRTGKTTVVVIGEQGKEKLTPAELADLAK